MSVSDIMKRNVVKIERDAPARDAMKIMIENDIGSLLVEKGSDYGIITRKDIVNKVIACGKNPMEVKVRDIMTESILTVSPDMSITETARLMAKTNVRRFPVVDDDGKLVGIVSNSDILRSTIP